MGNPASVTSSRGTNVQFTDSEGLIEGAPPSARAPEVSQLELYDGPSSPGVSSHSSVGEGETISSQQLAASTSQWKKQLNAVRDGLEAPVSKIIDLSQRVGCEPGGTSFDSIAGEQFSKTFDDKALWDGFKQLPKEQIVGLIETQVRKSMPKASPEEQQKVTRAIVGRLDEQLLYQGAQQLREAVVSTMQKTADSFERLAGDPAQLTSVLRALEDAEHGTAQQQADASGLRKALGLNERGSLGEQAEALRERAGVIRHQAEEVKSAETPDVLYQKVGKFEIAGAVAEQSHIKEGSWAGERLDAVREEGESREKTIKYISWAAKGAAIVGTAGTGVALALTMGGLEVAEAWEGVDVAKAGEASGLLAKGSIGHAQVHAGVATVAVATEVIVGGAMTRQALLGAGHSGHHASHLIAEGVLAATVTTATEWSHQAESGQGESAIARANVVAATSTLQKQPQVKQAVLDAAVATGRTGKEQAALFARFMLEHGSQLATMNPTQLRQAFKALAHSAAQ